MSGERGIGWKKLRAAISAAEENSGKMASNA